MKKFIIKGTIEFEEKNIQTLHTNERTNRIVKVEQLMREEDAKRLEAYVVDKGHSNGDEVHVLYNNGIVRIYNLRTGKHITDLIARLPQMERYGIKCTKCMKQKIKRHVRDGLNELY